MALAKWLLATLVSLLAIACGGDFPPSQGAPWLQAIAHKILIAAYHILLEQAEYREFGESWLDGRSKSHTATTLVRHLERLTYTGHLEARAA